MRSRAVEESNGAKTIKTVAEEQLAQSGHEVQQFGSISRLPNGLSESECAASVKLLNRVLADTMTIRDLYKKHHWQVAGAEFYSLHLLFDKHYEEQSELVDAIAERIQLLGGISVAMAHDVADLTGIERPPMGREDPAIQISRLLAAHEMIVKEIRAGSKGIADADPGSDDLLISEVLRRNEMQTWFLGEHLAATTSANRLARAV